MSRVFVTRYKSLCNRYEKGGGVCNVTPPFSIGVTSYKLSAGRP